MPNRPEPLVPPADLVAGFVVFLVALPLCLGVAAASGAPAFSGVLAGIVGGIVVGSLSGSHTSVSGPAAGLTAVVAAQIASLGSFPTFLFALVVAGALQIALGLARLGFFAVFFPSSVIKGLLAAIGVILALKQLPHLFGHDSDPEGEMSFSQPDGHNTFSELVGLLGDLHPGAATVGLASLGLLYVWSRAPALKKSLFPAPLAVVLLGVALSAAFGRAGGTMAIGESHLVQVPRAATYAGFLAFLQWPDFSGWANLAVYKAAVVLAAVASLETLLNLEAIDKLDRRQRSSPPSRELVAQGVGNIVSGLLGGLPVTSVVVRSSVNVEAGGRTRAAAIFHGVLLLGSVLLLPQWLNLIPLSCLAAILFATGLKLASPALFKRMWREGPNQFLPFVVTVAAIVATDLLTGTLVGLAASLAFILASNMRQPLRRIVENHLGGEVVRVELGNQVSFLNRAALTAAFNALRPGGHVLLDATDTDYIDPDVLDLIRDFAETVGPARGVEVSLRGFRDRYRLQDQTQFVDYSTRELQHAITPAQALRVLQDGHQRFRTGQRLSRDFTRQMSAVAEGQHPLAVVVSCIDSRAPAEILFDSGLGDIFSVRIAGNVVSPEVLGSVEYGCAVAGAKLVLALGHTRCGAVTAAAADGEAASRHIAPILHEIRASLDEATRERLQGSPADRAAAIDDLARRNVLRTVERLCRESAALSALRAEGRLAIVGAMYDIVTGDLEFLPDAGAAEAEGTGATEPVAGG